MQKSYAVKIFRSSESKFIIDFSVSMIFSRFFWSSFDTFPPEIS